MSGVVTIISSSLDAFEVRWIIDDLIITGYNRDERKYFIKAIESETFKLWGCDWAFNLRGKKEGPDDNKVVINFEQNYSPQAENLETKAYLKATFSNYNDHKYFNNEENETKEGSYYEMFSLTDNEISNRFHIDLSLNIENCDILLPSPAKRFKSLSSDLGKMLEDTKGHDFTIKCNGVKMTAHRNILASRCPVFAAMFEADMKEARESQIEMNETTPESVGAMLNWIYTCNIDERDKGFALDLIKLAHMYEMTLLMEECGPILISQIKKENVIDILAVSDLVGAKEVKENAIQFIIRDHSIIKKGEFLTKMSKELMREIILASLNRGHEYRPTSPSYGPYSPSIGPSYSPYTPSGPSYSPAYIFSDSE